MYDELRDDNFFFTVLIKTYTSCFTRDTLFFNNFNNFKINFCLILSENVNESLFNRIPHLLLNVIYI